MKLIAGLGNPGAKYELTRHNVGFLVIDALSDKFGITVSSGKFKGVFGKGRILGEEVVLIKPETFMNLSGDTIIPALNFFKIAPEDLIVIHDDLDMESLKVKAKFGGGHGGHNGIRDILAKLGHDKFHRLKVGIDRPRDAKDGTVHNWVLGPIPDVDLDKIPKVVVDEVVMRLDNIFKNK